MHLFSKGSDYELVDMELCLREELLLRGGTFAGGGGERENSRAPPSV